MLGVLIMNTGTPDAPTEDAIRPYLREFLSDRNVVDMPSFVWKPILHCFILPHRPKRTAPIYQAFWTEAGSPFVLDSFKQRDKLQSRLTELAGQPVAVELGMRYGNPSIASGIEALLDAGVDRLVALPLYPQRTKACAGTCLEEFHKQLEALCVQRGVKKPQVVCIAEYWNAPGYLDVLAESVRAALEDGDASACSSGFPEKLVVSFHSIPMSAVRQGDTYPDATAATAARLGQLLGMDPHDVLLAYQSRFDSRKWVGPFLPAVLDILAAQGVRDVAVVCPGFSVDCTETVHEVGRQSAQHFLDAAGGADARFRYVPALGAADDLIDVLARLILGSVAS